MRRYGVRAGNPEGHREDPARCVAEVRESGRWPHYHQCSNKRGHGPDGLYCRTHDPEGAAKKAREARSSMASRRFHAESGYRSARSEALKKLREFVATVNYVPDDVREAVDALETAEREASETKVQMWRLY